ncbi:MAG: hypothetical protein WCC64_17305, partial [Aliidongia sp.]
DENRTITRYGAMDRLLKTGLINEQGANNILNMISPIKADSSMGNLYRVTDILAKLAECSGVSDREAAEKARAAELLRDIASRFEGGLP